MIRGVYSAAGAEARDLERVQPPEGQLIVRGPLAVAGGSDGLYSRAEVDGVTCAMSGYLYDPGETARRLELNAATDAELVARAYRRLGEGALTELRGRFAVVLWDEHQRRGLLSSDLFATEPLFFWQGGDRLVFATSHRDLIDMLPSTPGPDRSSFVAWLGGLGCPSGATLFEGISQLRPGHLIELGVDGTRPRRYWQPRYAGTLEEPRAELADRLRDELGRSVQKRLSPRFSGVVLSGGLDSSIVTSVASRTLDEGRRLGTFSGIFPGEEYDEAWKIRSLLSAVDVEPTVFEIEPQGSLWLCLRNLQQWKQPLIGAGGIVETAAVYEAAREGVDVVLDGQTGDETLGFSPYLVADRLMRGRVLAAMRLTRDWPRGRPTTRPERLWLLRRFGLMGAVPYRAGRLVRSRRSHEGLGPKWLGPAARSEFMELQDVWTWKRQASGPRWWQYLSDRLVEAPHRELRMDYLRHRAGAVGVVNESPLYDPDLVDFCLRLPPQIAFENAHTRPLAREAMRGLIPDDVRLSNKKANFAAFCYTILTGADAPGIDRLLTAPDAELGAYADMDWVRWRWLHDRPKPGEDTGPWGTIIWRLVAGECWLRSLADPGFVEDMLARPDVLPISTRRVTLGDGRVLARPEA